MTHLLPPLNALRAFEAAARHLSFTLAAHELHVTAGAVGQQIRSLEDRLGVRLFDRLTRQVALTPAGQAYLGPVRDAFARIAAATAGLRPEGTTALLHIGVHARVDIAHLRDGLSRFRRAQPQVATRLSQPAGPHDLIQGKVDVLIDGRPLSQAGYRCDALGDGFLIAPCGTADCPEVATLRYCLLADRATSAGSHRSSRIGLMP